MGAVPSPVLTRPLAPHTTLRIGGPAERLVVARSADEVVDAVRTADVAQEPLLLLGGGSNVVIADGGVPGAALLVRSAGYTVGALCAALFALYLVVLSLPGWRDFFEVAAPDPAIILVSLVGTALAVTGLVLTDERFLPIPGRNPPGPPEPPSGSAPA